MIDASRPARPAASTRAVLLIVGVVLGVAALKLAQPVLVPLVAGAFIGVLAQPLLRRLDRALPSWLALTVTMLVVLVVLAAFLAALAWSVRDVANALSERRETLEATAEQLRQRAARAGIPLRTGGDGGASSVARPVLGTIATTIGGLLMALAVAALGLAEAGELRARLLRALSRGRGAATLDALGDIAHAFRRYVWVKSLTSAITGVASGLLALAFGLPLAWVWGFLAFLLEFVPTVGSLIAVVPPTLMALADAAASGGGLARAGTVFLAFGALQVVLGNVIDPRIEGKLMTLSPLGVLVSIIVWGWIWGAAGALLAVPLTVAIVLICRRIPGARGVATVLGGEDEARTGEARTEERALKSAH